jgi:hypothetical protein
MRCFPRHRRLSAVSLFAGFALGTITAFAGEAPSTADTTKHANRMNCGAQIECMTPDGQIGHISRLPAQDPTAVALITQDDTVTCALQEGETNFVIELPEVALPDRFIFLNENGAARGELKISVSNQALSPKSPKWREVEGVIPFSHKRLFGVSLLGIEAKYVRLSFRVDKQGGAENSSASVARVSASSSQPVRHSVEFQASALDHALNSSFGTSHVRQNPVLLSYITSSVGPLRLTPPR